MLYKSLNTLKVTDIYNLELGKFMHQLENNKLPLVFLNFLKKINEIHSYETKCSYETIIRIFRPT